MTDVLAVNLPLPKPPGARGQLFQHRPAVLLGLAVTLVFACAEGRTVVSNYPGIYLVTAPRPDVTNGLGYWMWDKVTFNKQTVRLWRRFDVPTTNPVVRAELRIAADNAYKAWLDGQELGSGSDWRTLSIYHLEGALSSGPHVVAVEGFNDNDQAGIILGLRLEMADGQDMEIRSDQSWRVVPNSESGWETAPRAAENWPGAFSATNFGRIPWWTIPTSVLHIHGALPKPIPVWQRREFQIGLFAGCGVFVVICLYLLIQLVSQSKAHYLVQAERDRIARDIHDDLGSRLTQLLLTGELAQIKPTSDGGAPFSQMCDSARNILGTIDEVVWIVNSQHDNLNDFVIYLCKYTQQFLNAAGIRSRFDVPAELPEKRLSQFMRRNLFLAVKEALNNAVKHSQATQLTVRIELNGSRLLVAVTDNGRGFDPGSVGDERNGLGNMKLRLAEIGGACEIVSGSGEGCLVCFRVPLKPESFLKQLFRARPQNDFATQTRLVAKDVSASAKR